MDIEKLAKEKDADYALFVQYLQMRRRSVQQLALDLSIPIQKLKAIAKLNKWEVRAKKHDKESADLYAQKKQEAIANLAENQASEELLVSKINNALIKEILLKYLLQEKSSEDIGIDIRDLERLSNMSKKSEFNISVSSHQDYSSLSDAELKQLEKIANKIKD